MSQLSTLYRPSLLDLARAGNFQAIARWMNSLLRPQGISIQVQSARSKTLNIWIHFHNPPQRELCVRAKQRLVKFICYRLWTLNSAVICDVRIAARIAGESPVLWQEFVRIKTPANAPRLRQRHTPAWTQFQILRSAFFSRFTFAGFVLCYWLLHWELASRPRAPIVAAAATTPAANPPTLLYKEGQLSAGISSPRQDFPRQPPISAAPQAFVGKVISTAPGLENQKVVALTFDDGPWEGSTEKILEILKQNDIKATFYMVGLQLQKNPEIARRVAVAGHAIGNHTWRHPIADLDTPTAAEEVGNTARLIYQTTGVRTNLFRPPGGNLTGELVPYAQRQKYSINLWSVESNDYYVSAPLIVDNVLQGVKPGGVVLMHDGGGDRTATVQALPQIIAALRRQGYRFVTVPELLTLSAKATAIARSSPPPASPSATPTATATSPALNFGPPSPGSTP
jgi:peptidoglycan/xylan/chitin deacetylase (PgdA/CDA1 family)